MARRSIVPAAAVFVPWLAIGLIQAPLGAHHSSASAYDASKRVDVAGTVTRVLLRNPHSFVFLEATDATGAKVEWQIELSGFVALTTQGWTSETLTPGMTIKVSGIPSRAEGSHGIANALVTRPDGTPVGRGGAAAN